MKKIIRMAAVAVVMVLCLAGCGGERTSGGGAGKTTDGQTNKTENQTVSGQAVSSQAVSGQAVKKTAGKQHVEIKIKKYGTLKVELDADAAPITVANFIKLAKDGFYDGLTFHRIISGFMIQGGDPNGDGTGGSKKTIKGEFSSNGVKNDIKHERGVISMARAQDKDSASSQFFIMHDDAPHLDGEYAAFGRVTEGMEIVDKICSETPVLDGNGTVEKEKQPVIEKITVVD